MADTPTNTATFNITDTPWWKNHIQVHASASKKANGEEAIDTKCKIAVAYIGDASNDQQPTVTDYSGNKTSTLTLSEIAKSGTTTVKDVDNKDVTITVSHYAQLKLAGALLAEVPLGLSAQAETESYNAGVGSVTVNRPTYALAPDSNTSGQSITLVLSATASNGKSNTTGTIGLSVTGAQTVTPSNSQQVKDVIVYAGGTQILKTKVTVDAISSDFASISPTSGTGLSSVTVKIDGITYKIVPDVSDSHSFSFDMKDINVYNNANDMNTQATTWRNAGYTAKTKTVTITGSKTVTVPEGQTSVTVEYNASRYVVCAAKAAKTGSLSSKVKIT